MWLLAGLTFIGVPAVTSARVLGIASLAAAAAFTTLLLEPAARRWRSPWIAPAGGALVALCGPMLWFALSGMETVLFVALGLAALLAYRSERWILVGVCLGLLYLTRPEGIGLALALAALEIVRHRKIPAHLWKTAAVAALLALPWQGYVLWRTGELLPGSYYGKQFSQQIALDYFTGRVAWLAPITHLRPVVFAGLSLGYWFLYYWGGAYLPGPRLAVEAAGAPVVLTPALIAVASTALWVALMARGLALLWKTRQDSDKDDARTWLAFGLWAVVHNGAFALMLPTVGTASRYIAVDYALMIGAVALGLARAPAALMRYRLFGKTMAAGFVGTGRADDGQGRFLKLPALSLALFGLAIAAITLSTLTYWREIYLSSVRQVAEVREPMAEQVASIAPPEAVVAAFDIGVIGYYSRRPVADLGGLTDARFLDYAAANQVNDYLCDVKARYLVAPESNAASGGSFYDYLGSLGLDDKSGVKLVRISRIEMEEEAWRVGGAATGNSTAAVLLYRVEAACTD